MNRYRYRGRHRAPSAAGRTAARIATAAAAVTAPLVIAPAAFASPPGVADAIAICESGNTNVDRQATDGASTASGYYQFVNDTWRAHGGREFAPRAVQATKTEQTVVFERVYAANGLKDWEASRSCWQPKMGRHEVKTGRHASGQETHAAPTRGRHHRADHTAGHIHVAQRGDTLADIAYNNDITLRAVIAANREIIDDPTRIFPGQRIRV